MNKVPAEGSLDGTLHQRGSWRWMNKWRLWAPFRQSVKDFAPNRSQESSLFRQTVIKEPFKQLKNRWTLLPCAQTEELCTDLHHIPPCLHCYFTQRNKCQVLQEPRLDFIPEWCNGTLEDPLFQMNKTAEKWSDILQLRVCSGFSLRRCNLAL